MGVQNISEGQGFPHGGGGGQWGLNFLPPYGTPIRGITPRLTIAIEYIVWPTFYVNNGDVT